MKIRILISAIVCFLAVSCKKQLELPVGTYTANFYGDVVEQNTGIPSGKVHNSTGIYLEISNVTETALEINGIVLERTGDRIEGVIYVSGDYSIQPVVSGTIVREKKVYRIEGIYKARLYPYLATEYGVFGGYVGGNFEITAN